MIDYSKIKKDFPMLNQKMQGRRLVYLDNAATTFKPQPVIDKIVDYMSNYTANAYRGDYDLSSKVDNECEKSREKVAKFLNAESREIIFTSGTSAAINIIANGIGLGELTAGDEILLTQAEHASNVLPWFNVAKKTGALIKYIPLDDKGLLTPENVAKTISDRTRVVSIAHVTNVLGFIVDVKSIAKVVRQVPNCLLIIDGAQSVPHMKTDVKDLDCDFLTFSGHKMCGPTGIGVLYGKYAILERMEPLFLGGGMNSKFDTCGNVLYLKPPRKFEAGTPNIEGIIGLGAAIDYLEEIGMDNIHEHEKMLCEYATKLLKNLDNIEIYNKGADSSIITFNIKGVFAQDAATHFNSYGIAVRAGQHCAKILMDYLETVATVRASFYFYNTKEDVEAFVEAVKNGGDYLNVYF